VTNPLRSVFGPALLLVVAGVLAACGGTAGPSPTSLDSVPTATSAAPTTSGSATPSPAPSATPVPGPGGTAAGPGAAADRPLLWPFADAAAARSWQLSFRGGGGQPWHLDSAATALGFTQGFLGFAGLDRVTTKENSGADAWVGVGYRASNGSDATAAVLHPVRFGTEEDAPWEVVGTRDTTLSIDTPAYGSAVRWPLTVGGTVTGADESLHVRVLGTAGAAGDACCTPAGGQQSRWTVSVPQKGNPAGALTVVVSTGGHVVDVERFAITAVHTG